MIASVDLHAVYVTMTYQSNGLMLTNTAMVDTTLAVGSFVFHIVSTVDAFPICFYGNKCCVIWSNVIIYSALNVQCTTVYSIFNTLLFVKRSGDGKSVVVCCFIHTISLKFQWHFINVIVMQWWGTKVIYSGYTRIFVMPLNW